MERLLFDNDINSPTNKQFVIIENDLISRLEEEIAFTRFENLDDTHTICRLVTNWATTPGQIEELGKIL